MPLSEHEQKLLDQMERALYAEDPKFATQMKGPGRTASRSRLVLGILAAVLGLVIVVLGVNAASIALGVVGFVVMVAGVVWAAAPQRGAAPGGQLPPTFGAPAKKAGKNPLRRTKGSRGTFMQKMDERWERRRREGDF